MELELKMVVIHLVQMLGIKSGSSQDSLCVYVFIVINSVT